jgi:hypothetical protein
LFFSIHAVHTEQHFGPVLAFGATRAGVDLHHGGQFVFGLIEGAFELRLFDLAEGLVIGFSCLFFGGFAAFPEVEEYGKIFYGRLDGFVEFYPVFVQLDILQDLCCALVIVPEPGA